MNVLGEDLTRRKINLVYNSLFSMKYKRNDKPIFALPYVYSGKAQNVVLKYVTYHCRY
jgi:hypothetical protein